MYHHQRVKVVRLSIRYSCPILMKLEISEQIFRKILKY